MSKYRFPLSEAADTIASAMSKKLKRPIDRSQVVIEPHGDAVSQYVVTIYKAPDIAKKVIPFLDRNGSIPIEIGTLCPVGFRTNRKECSMNPWQHGQIIGATESGKSSCLHVLMGHVTRCPDCFVWVGGVWKLWDFVGSWIEPYVGSDFRPPIERIAHGQQDVCDMLAAFLNVASYRLNLRNHQRTGLKYGILILDEFTYIADNRYVTTLYNGENLNAGKLTRDVVCGTAGAKQYSWITAQRDTMDNFGDQGGTITTQPGFTFLFYLKDRDAIGRTMGNYGLDLPRSKGECWLDLGMTGGVNKLRIPYPQADDPLKEVLHGGPKVSEIAWARRNINHEMDPGSLTAADEYFPNRFPFVTEEYIDYLSKPPSKKGRANKTGADGVDAMLSGMIPPELLMQLSELDREYKLLTQEGGEAEAAGDGSSERSQYTTLSDRVCAVVVANSAKGKPPMSRKEIIDSVEREFGEVAANPNVVTNYLGNHCKGEKPRLAKTDDNKYYAL